MKERRNIHAVSDPLLSALAIGAERELISSAVVVKTNEASTIGESRHRIMLACDGGAPRDLLLMLLLLL